MTLHRSPRFWAAAAVLACTLALLPFSFHSERHLETATRVEGSDAQKVGEELKARFNSNFVNQVVLVVEGLPPLNSDEGTQALSTLVDDLKEQPGVAGVVSWLDLHDSIFAGTNGGTYIVMGLKAPDGGSVEPLVPDIAAYAKTLQAKLRPKYPKLDLKLTGELPLNFDIRKASSDEVQRSESLAVPVTLALLLLAFGSVVAALIPLAVGQLAIAATLAIAALLASRFHLSILVQNLATMLGLGLGIDYTLLMVSRFREAVAAGHDGPTASVMAAKRAGRTLVVSASTVAIGFVVLLTVPISEIRSIGVAGCLVAGICVLLATTVVPAVLGMLGRRIDAGRLPFVPQMDASRSEHAGRRWRRWGQTIVAHPWLAIVLAGAPLVALAWQATKLDTSLPKGDWLPKAAESVVALHEMEGMGRIGVVQSIRVLIDLPNDSILDSDAGWAALNHASQAIAADPRCLKVISLSSLANGDRGFLDNVPRESRRTFISRDGHAALLEIAPTNAVSLRGQVDWVRDLRAMGAEKLTGVPNATILVGGVPALNADYETIIDKSFPSVMTMVVIGTLLALFAGFRSVVVALKALVLNLLSVAASFGALVLVFQMGYGSGLMGFPGGTGSVFPLVPIVTFAITFGLSMDYEIFLVARVLEARRAGLSETDAIPEALARTAGLITSAAAIMIVVFAAFCFGNFLVIKMIGFTLSTAVLIDATLVRIVIGPALLRVAGDWNWWPGGLSKR